MIAFIYRMRPKPGREHDFDEAWRASTLIARERFGSGGSHLFALDDGTRVAIALWPDRESRDRYFAWRRQNQTPASESFSAAIDQDLGEEMLTSIDDLWLPTHAQPRWPPWVEADTSPIPTLRTSGA